MTWVRLDDSFSDNPKVAGISDAAFRAYVTALCYCARQLTDGVVPTIMLRRLGIRAKDITELVEVGLWHEADVGIVIHDYLKYNASRAKIEAERESSRMRQERFRTTRSPGAHNETQYNQRGSARHIDSQHVTNGVTDGVTNAVPSHPIPSDPDLTETYVPKDLAGSARDAPPEEHSGVREKPEANREEEHETVCPLDLAERAERAGIHEEFAKFYATTVDAVREVIQEFVAYWTIGGGQGKRRKHWLTKLRQKLKETGQQNRFKAQGQIDHERRTAAQVRRPRRKPQAEAPAERLSAEQILALAKQAASG